MGSTTNIKTPHISHLLSQTLSSGKPSKEGADTENLYKGPQLTPIFSSANCVQKCAENNVLSSVLKRVSTLEGSLEKSKKRLKQALNIIKEKDNEIVRLKEQIRLIEDEQKNTSGAFVTQSELSALANLTKSLQERISTIEMCSRGDPYLWYKSDAIDNDQVCHCNSFNYESPDLDLLFQQINELNFEAGEMHVCQKTQHGASFQSCQSILLIFFSNGMQLEGHPFREYTDLRTQFFIKDIIDGFFPSELQCEYPRGVIFKVCDRRNDTYNEVHDSEQIFKGQGCRLDSNYEANRSCMKDISIGKRKGRSTNTNYEDLKAEKDKNNSFVSTLPLNSEGSTIQVMQLNKDFYKRRVPDANRNMYSINGSGAGDGHYNVYRQSNGENFSLPNITIKDGQVCNKKVHRSKSHKPNCMTTSRIKYLNPGARSTDSCIQLKIRSINDKDLFILTMHANEHVGKLRSYLPEDVKECNIMHYKDNYNRIYLTDNKSTLKDYGILKNSVLVLSKGDRDVE